jgi:hypothetical protein
VAEAIAFLLRRRRRRRFVFFSETENRETGRGDLLDAWILWGKAGEGTQESRVKGGGAVAVAVGVATCDFGLGFGSGGEAEKLGREIGAWTRCTQ